MIYFLFPRCPLKWLEFPAVYNISSDELYELDEVAFDFLRRCGDEKGCDSSQCDPEFLDYARKEGILTTRRMTVRRPPLTKTSQPSLRYLELQITRKCNLRCKHCYIGPSEDVELPQKKIVNILNEFEEMQGLRLLITGGEPLLHTDFQGINDALPAYAFRKVLFTNGTSLSKEGAGKLNVDEVQISIDGLEPGHDALRGGGTYRRAMNAIKTARKAGMDVSVSTMVHSKNLEDFDGMEHLFKEMGIKEWSVDVPCVEGNLRDSPLFQVKPEIAGMYLRYGFGEGLHGGGQGFACGLHLASVMADGRVARCSFYSGLSVGTADEGLDVCWRRIVPQRIEELACDCSVKDVCRGGCRFRAELLQSRLGKDLYRCHAYGINP